MAATRRIGQNDTCRCDIAQVIQSDPDILGGVPVFVGTRVPVQTLLDYLGAGDSLGEFLDDFPTVTREQAHRELASDDAAK